MKGKETKLFVISAPSGSGKTTIVKYILNTFHELTYSISATTRAKRSREIDGKDYFFITNEEFEQKVKNNEFIEWQKFYDYYYGTLSNHVYSKLKQGKPVVLELDVKGALNLKKIFPNAVLIFIKPPELDELKKRLKKRNSESEIDFEKRIQRAKMELSFAGKFDYCITNKNLTKAEEEVKKIIEKEITKEDK